MSSEKDSMLRTANSYASKVDAARTACETAKSQISTVAGTVGDNWKGEAGSAMVQALESLTSQLSSVISELSSAASAMRSEAQSIYNSWPEEDEAITDG